MFDLTYRSSPAVTRAIHDYFLAKSLDKARAGGVVALITSRYMMDKQDATIRQYLAERANLIGAIRLPNTAFKANAGTEAIPSWTGDSRRPFPFRLSAGIRRVWQLAET